MSLPDSARDASLPEEMPLPSATPLRLTWPVTSEPRFEQPGTPAAIAPDGTLYVARSRLTATRRVLRGVDIEDTLVAAFDARGVVRFRIPALPGVTAMPRGIVADARGAYVFVRYSTAFELPGLRIDAPLQPATAVIALDPSGAVRWARTLGEASWDDGTLLSGRREDRLVLVGTARGVVALGAHATEGTITPHLFFLGLSREGADLALRDLGAVAADGVVADVNAQGEAVTATLLSNKPYPANPYTRLDRWSSDGNLRWTHTAPRSSVVLDDEGNVYLTSPGLCPLVSLWRARCCVAAVNVAGNARWFAPIFTDPGTSDDVDVHQLDAWWSEGALSVSATLLLTRIESSASIPPTCMRRRFDRRFASLDATGAVLGPESSGADPAAVLRVGSRRCVVSYRWPMPSGCAFSPGLPEGEISCEGDARGCGDEQVRCGDACVDLATDLHNCGACGRSCVGVFPHAAGVCIAGACHYGICEHGRASCDGLPNNGCETDVSSDASHCGACDVRCDAGESCRGGLCCAGDRCAGSPYRSDGTAGAFAPTADVTLDGAVRQVTTAMIPEGVTVRSADNVVRLYAQGEVRLDGTIDLSGRAGRTCPAPAPDTGCSETAPGASPGLSGYISANGLCLDAPMRPDLPAMIHPAYGMELLVPVACSGNCRLPEGYAWDGCLDRGHQATNGSIGVAALEDLAVYTVFEAGSRAGAVFHEAVRKPGINEPAFVVFGGGGGGAIRIASATRIVLGPRARVIAAGRDGGSGGVIVLHAPEVRVVAGAELRAPGIDLRSMPFGLGRVRVSTDTSRCTLEGTFTPPLADGCRPTPPEHALAHTYVTPWPL